MPHLLHLDSSADEQQRSSLPSSLKAWIDHIHVPGVTAPFDVPTKPLAGQLERSRAELARAHEKAAETAKRLAAPNGVGTR